MDHLERLWIAAAELRRRVFFMYPKGIKVRFDLVVTEKHMLLSPSAVLEDMLKGPRWQDIPYEVAEPMETLVCACPDE